MEYSAILHDMDKRFCYAIDKDLFVIRVQVKKDDIKEIILHYEDKYIPLEWKDTRKRIPMKKVATSQFHDYYEAQLQMHLICLRYYFEFTDMQGEKIYYGNYEFSRECITNRDRMFDCPQNLREEEMFEVPEWAANKVVYQIFPSRFAASQPIDKELWYKAPITSKDNLHGDLRGIIDHLDHIQKLGIDVMYLTPIFKSDSSHKYDTTDYYQIDPSFGTTEDLKELVQKAHECGMKVVMDAVFNHTGRDFFAFKDIIEKEEKSRYLDWYFIERFPLKGEKPLLMGGGIGVPPMVQLGKTLKANGCTQVQTIAGYRDELFLAEELGASGAFYVATEDGSAGTKGNVLDAVREQGIEADVIYACGPKPMLRAIKAYAEEKGIECYLSMEERMACGVGACLACVCKSKDVDSHSHVHNKRVCKDGPVFNAEDIEI